MTNTANIVRSLVAATAALLLATLCVGTATSGSLGAPVTTTARIA